MDSARPLGQRERHVVHPDPVEPAFQSGRLAPEPGWVDQDDPLGPSQRIEVVAELGPGVGVTEVVGPFERAEPGVEVEGVEVDDAIARDPDIARKLVEACPVDIFAQRDEGTLEIVEENLDECVLCYLCVDAAPDGTVRVIKLYEQ